MLGLVGWALAQRPLWLLAFRDLLDIAAHQHYHFMKQSSSIYLASKKRVDCYLGLQVKQKL